MTPALAVSAIGTFITGLQCAILFALFCACVAISCRGGFSMHLPSSRGFRYFLTTNSLAQWYTKRKQGEGVRAVLCG